MRLGMLFLLAIAPLYLSGCGDTGYNYKTAENVSPSAASSGDVAEKSLPAQVAGQQGQRASTTPQRISLTDPGAIQGAVAATDRKIIRNGELTIETNAPADGQRQIAAIAEAHGGFVVTSEISHNESGRQTPESVTVTVIARVPSAQFQTVLEKIRGIGGRIKQDKTTSQDVTEEYIDLEARLRAKRALEAQFLEIMKQARKISDALEVQSQLADVRVEIEQLEGRRRFLEHQSALSTITVTLRTPAPVVTASPSGFVQSLRQSFGDSIDVAAAIILGLIRLIVILLPIVALVGLPSFLLLRFCARRYGWFRKQPQPVPQPE
jgi:hypothetical protein